MYKRIVVFVVITLLIYTTPVHAHIMNTTNMYTDIEKSPDKDAILYTYALNLIFTDEVRYKPANKLLQKDFAVWYSHFLALNLTEKQAIKNALDKGWINFEDEALTYGQLNIVLLENRVELEKPGETVTRGGYARFIMKYAKLKLSAGHTLLDKAAVKEGPTGIISTVQEPNKHTNRLYTLTVDGKDYQLAEHPSVVNNSTDPLVWQGQRVKTSLVGTQAVSDRIDRTESKEGSKLHYLEIETVEKKNQIATQAKKEPQQEKIVRPFLGWVVIGLLVLLGWILFTRQNKRK